MASSARYFGNTSWHTGAAECAVSDVLGVGCTSVGCKKAVLRRVAVVLAGVARTFSMTGSSREGGFTISKRNM